MNDDNKLHIIECGALPYYAQVFRLWHHADEHRAAIQGIRRLASKFRDRVLKQFECVEGIQHKNKCY